MKNPHPEETGWSYHKNAKIFVSGVYAQEQEAKRLRHEIDDLEREGRHDEAEQARMRLKEVEAQQELTEAMVYPDLGSD